MSPVEQEPRGDTSAWAELAWDCLSLRAPAGLEPVRLGRGYMLLEDERGPRLELRWQPVRAGFSLDRALSRARLVRLSAPGSLVGGAIALLPDPGRAAACAPAKDPQRQSLLMLLPAGRLAVAAGFFPDPGGEQAPNAGHAPRRGRVSKTDLPSTYDRVLARVVASLDDSRPQAVSLYDIALRVPEGMSLAEFSFELGRFRLLYRDKGRTLEYARFAPARVILAGTGLADWTSRALEAWAGRGQTWRETVFSGRQAAELTPRPDLAGRSFFVRLATGLSPGTKPARGLAWLGDSSRILAVRAGGDLSPEAFGAICRDYVVSSSSA